MGCLVRLLFIITVWMLWRWASDSPDISTGYKLMSFGWKFSNLTRGCPLFTNLVAVLRTLWLEVRNRDCKWRYEQKLHADSIGLHGIQWNYILSLQAAVIDKV